MYVGSNLVATTLFLQLEQLTEEFGEPIKDLVMQVDNTVAEAKNNYLVSFLGMLVARGVLETATLLFMLVGHTHMKIDQTFGRCDAVLHTYPRLPLRDLLGQLAVEVQSRNYNLSRLPICSLPSPRRPFTHNMRVRTQLTRSTP